MGMNKGVATLIADSTVLITNFSCRDGCNLALPLSHTTEAVAVGSLVERGEVAEVGRRGVYRGGPPVVAREGRGVLFCWRATGLSQAKGLVRRLTLF